MRRFKEIQIPIIIKPGKTQCDIYIPDLDMTVHGTDYVDAIANASMKASAVYFYNLERNIALEFKHTYASVEELAKKNKRWFATYIALVS